VVQNQRRHGPGHRRSAGGAGLRAELRDLKADDTIPATGWVVEAKLSSQQGPVATVLIKEGQLNRGDVILAGNTYGRVKAMRDSYGRDIKVATSSMPVEIVGLNDVPQAGDRFYCLDDLNRASRRRRGRLLQRERSLAERTQVTMENLFSRSSGQRQGVEPDHPRRRAGICGCAEEVPVRIEHVGSADQYPAGDDGGDYRGRRPSGRGSNAIIIGFNVVADEHAAKTAESPGRRHSTVQHHLSDHRRFAEVHGRVAGARRAGEVSGPCPPFGPYSRSPESATVAGCYVTSGVVAKSAKARLIRDNIIVRDGLTIES